MSTRWLSDRLGWEDARGVISQAKTLARRGSGRRKGVGARARRVVPARGAAACADVRPALRVLWRAAMPPWARGWHGGGGILAPIMLVAIAGRSARQHAASVRAPRATCPTRSPRASAARASPAAYARPSPPPPPPAARAVAALRLSRAQSLQAAYARVLRRSFTGTCFRILRYKFYVEMDSCN